MDALLLGRRTYEIFAGYWPTAPNELDFTGLMNGSRSTSPPARSPPRWTKKLSQTGQAVIASEPEQGARELEQPEVVAGVLVPADQHRAAFGQPSQCPLHHPTAGFVALGARRPLVAMRAMWGT
jgi:hypothetical protein